MVVLYMKQLAECISLCIFVTLSPQYCSIKRRCILWKTCKAMTHPYDIFMADTTIIIYQIVNSVTHCASVDSLALNHKM